MARLQVDNVSVQFPIYNANARSLKTRLMHLTTGGRIGRDAGNRVCVEALSEVTLSFEHGDRIALVGHNGAGKTTLLRVLSGIYEPTRGAVYCEGRVVSLFDMSLGMNLEATGIENIVLRGRFLGLSANKIRERLTDIAAFTELGDYLAMPVRTYSTGMVVRLAFAVCTSIEPEIMLMDEWIGAGDASFLEKAKKRFDEFIGRAGILVVASHSTALLETYCNKGVLMHAGRVEAFGPIGDILRVYEKYRPAA
jgi:ABC-2 type transport system ATP-binding protein/lipopolysaccharide transport system ATP-binding protein